MFSGLRRWIVAVMVGLAPVSLHGSDGRAIIAGQFSRMTPGGPVTGWEPMTFAKIESHTRYALVESDGRTVLRAESNASASGLVRQMQIDPQNYPLLSWTWKVSNTLVNGDVTQKSGDDYAARIYITFSEGPEQLSFLQRTQMAAVKLLYGVIPPQAALAYVWGNRAKVGSLHPNAYTSRLQMVVVDSGSDHLNHWRSVRRDIVKDFRQAFGTDPPLISGIAVMTDTDNTGESATAWFGDIVLERRKANSP